MTNTMHKVQQDRWVICSDVAFQSLSGFWRSETGASSLLEWRLASQMIEYVPVERLMMRLKQLTAEDAWNVLVVVEEADVALLEALERDHRNIQLVEWRQSPLAAILGMNAPDQALLTALQDAEASGAENLELASRISDHAGYVAALQAWEAECREGDDDTFADRLPSYANSAIPWDALLAQPAVEAANDNWIELIRLAAASSSEEGKPISLEDPRNKPAQWTLTLSPIDGGPSTLAVFRVNDTAIPAYQGCNIRLRVRGDIVNLGEIDEDGQAEIVLPAPVEVQGLAISWDEGDK